MLGLALAASAQDVPKPQLHGEAMASLFGPGNYPPAALRAREQGLVVVDLAIDTAGRVTDCTVVESAASSLSLQTCRLATGRAGLFSPAKNARGKAVVGHYSLKIRWQLPDDGDAPAGTADVATSYRVIADPDGRVKACEIGKPSKAQPIVTGGPACDQLARALVDAIARKTGKPPAQPFEGRFVIDYAPDATSHDVLAWPSDMIVLDDMNIAYALTAEGRRVECRRDIRVWDQGAPIPSPCDGQSEKGPSTPPVPTVSRQDALFRLGYRVLPEN